MKKNILAIALSASLVLSMVPLAFATESLISGDATQMDDIAADEEQEKTLADVVEAMDSFANIIAEMPDVDEILAFEAASQDYAEVHALAEKDSPLPDLEVAKFAEAHDALAMAMGYEAGEVEASYPESILEAELANDIIEALTLLADAEEWHAALSSDQIQIALLADAESESTVLPQSVLEFDESYAEAEKKLYAILDAKPDLISIEAGTYARDLGNGVSTVDSVSENIQINLFNYGPQINTQVSGYGFLPFVHSEGAYGWAVDSSGNNPSGAAGGWPVLKTSLSQTDDKYTYPYITEDKNSVIKAGSLGYLFNPNYNGIIDESTYNANILGAQNPYQYRSAYFEIDNDDGSGTGLFQKDGDYFVYDSGKNAAWYNQETNKFELYNYVVRPAYAVFSTAGTNGNFLPFNQGHVAGREDYQAETYKKEYSYTSDGEEVKDSTTIAKTDTVATKPAGALTAYRLYGNSRATEVDLWFGMSMEFDFYQPKGGLVSENAMEFEFFGDDDVFVYIDNVLILDIGGTHGSQKGTINFASGNVTNPSGYGQYGTADKANSTLYELMKAALGSSLDESDFVDSDGNGVKDTFANFSKHNLKFYYLERGGNTSYCKLKFNMEPLPTGSVNVTKAEKNLNEFFKADELYKFQLIDENGVAKSNEPYKITGNIIASQSTNDLITDSNGYFYLYGGQTASFTDVTVKEERIKVKEIVEDDSPYSVTCRTTVARAGGNTSTVVETEACTEELYLSDPDDRIDITFTNAWEVYSLDVTKQLADVESALSDDALFTFDLEFEMTNLSASNGVDFRDYRGEVIVYDDGSSESVTQTATALTGIQLKDGQKAVIEGIPNGMSYKLSEVSPEVPAGYEFKMPKFNEQEIEFGNEVSGTFDSNKSYVVKNEIVPLLGNLVIKKEGISELDHHNETASSETEWQSTVYTILGTSISGKQISMDVVIRGEGFVTIRDLPVGTYSVVEDAGWAWRYTPESGSTTVTVESAKTVNVLFKNARSNELWLGGDNYSTNIFAAISADGE